MRDAEYADFAAEVRRLATTLRLRASPTEVGLLTDAYFKAMRSHPLGAVIAGADVCIQRAKYFPKPAEWMDAIPRRQTTVDVPTLTDSEARDYRRAEELRYEDAPCHCPACVEAGVSEKPLRFVPEFTEADTDRKVRDPIGDRIVTAGHWAHGLELARWYDTRGNFWNAYYELLSKRSLEKPKNRGSFQQRIDAIFKPTPPPPPEPTT